MTQQLISKYNQLKEKLSKVIHKYSDGNINIGIVNKNFKKATNQKKH